MNKKSIFIAIAVSIIAVLVVALGYSALKDYFMVVKVESVEFVVDEEKYANELKEDQTYDGYILRFCVDNVNSYQLEWKVNPEDAENKNVTFASSNSKFTVSSEGLVAFTEKDEVAEITITTEDQAKTDKIKIETFSYKALEANYDFDTNTFEAGEDYFIENETLCLYNGKAYAFTLDYNISFAKADSTSEIYNLTNEENVYTIQTLNVGEFSIKAIRDGVEKTINVKVIEKVTGILLTNSNVTKNFVVGTSNTYKLPITVSTAGGTNAELVYSLIKEGATEETTTATFNYTVANFSNVEVGTYTLKVSAKYDTTKFVELTFTLNDGYNVTSHAEMSQYYNNEQIKVINIVNNYQIEIAETDKDPAKNVNMLETKNDETYLNINAKFIYYRKSAITVNGNNFTINASKVPHQYINKQLGHDRAILFGCGDYTKTTDSYYCTELSTTNGTSTIAQLIKAGTALNAEDQATQRAYVIGLYETAPKFVFNNLSLEGNLTANDYLKSTIDGVEGYNGAGTLNCFGLNASDVTLNNVRIKNFLMGIMQANYGNDSFALTLNGCSISDTFGYNIFTNGTAKMTVKDSAFSNAGHALIYNKAINSGLYIDHYTKIDLTNQEEANTFKAKYEGNVTFNNWINTTKLTPFITLSGDGAIFSGVVTVATQTMGVYVSNIVYKEGEDNYINFAIQNDSITSTKPAEVNYDFSQTENYNASHNKESYWTAFQAVYSGMYSADQAFAGIIKPQSYVNNSLVCCSFNAAAAGFGGTNALSFFYLGVNTGSIE